MEISYNVEYKKSPRTIYAPGMAGYGFYSNRRGTRGIGGVFYKMGGILAGYLNYWRPNLP